MLPADGRRQLVWDPCLNRHLARGDPLSILHAPSLSGGTEDETVVAACSSSKLD